MTGDTNPTTPAAVEALARVLEGYMGRVRPEVAERILADPGPLLAALAEAGVIHPQLCSRSGAACFNGWSGDE